MVHVIDTQHLGRGSIIAATVLDCGDGLTMFDCGPASTFDNVAAGLKAIGASPDDVRHVFLSHIHLDHAGAAWCFAERGAKVYVHPRGARHLMDPARLIESARRIFGDAMPRLWGEMRPIAPDRLIIAEDGEVFAAGDLAVRAIATPGHASHHNVYQWDVNLFGGDVAGVRIGEGPPVPPFVPPELDIEAWQESIATIRTLEPQRILLPHFGVVDHDVAAHLDRLSQRIARWAEWFRQQVSAGRSEEEIVPMFAELEAEELRESGVDAEGIADYEQADPSYMAVTASLRYWDRRGV